MNTTKKIASLDETLEKEGIVEAMKDAIRSWGTKYLYPDSMDTEDANAVVDWIRKHKEEFEAACDWREGEVPEYDPNFRQCVYCTDSPAWMWQDHDALDSATNACHRHQLLYMYESGMVFNYF